MPDWLKEWALAELRELNRAKTAAALLAALALGVGWLAASKYDADTVALMQLRAENAERGIARPPAPAAIGPNGLLIVGLVLAVGLGAAFLASAVRNKRVVSETEDEKEALRGLLNAGVAECQKLTDERDAAVVALKDRKLEYANETLQRYSQLKSKDDKKQTVKILYSSLGRDYEIAMQLKAIFRDQVRWEATCEESKTLPRAESFKVVFDTGLTLSYGPLIHAIQEGDFLGVTVGRLTFSEREDTERLIVMVLPSADATLIRS